MGSILTRGNELLSFSRLVVVAIATRENSPSVHCLEKGRTEYVNTMFSLPTLLYAGYNVTNYTVSKEQAQLAFNFYLILIGFTVEISQT